MRKFENPLNLLILTGFICQGLFNESYLVPASFAVAWIMCLTFRKQRQFIPKTLEFLILLASLLISVKFAGSGIFAKCFALGNGLTSLQLMRMLWPIDKRSKYYSVAIALTQVAVGSQVILGYGFIVVIAAVLLLLPKTLYILNEEDENPDFNFFSRDGYWLINHKCQYLGIALVTILFFLFFPRIKVFNTLNLYGYGKGIEITKPTLTTSLGGDSGDQTLLFRIYGDNIGYFKLFTLDTFDGNVWSQSQASFKSNFVLNQNSKEGLYRKVEIADNSYSSRFLPSDGYLLRAKGNFFFDPFFSEQGNLMVADMPGMSNRYYEYWSLIPEPFFKITSKDRQRYLRYPKMSLEINSFLENIVKGSDGEADTAQKIMFYLLKNFTYELGTPDLNSKQPIDDFIFMEKRGHCERFASALALFLRMKNIPSRVVIGFYTNEKNEFGNFFNIRNSHAHAWVEAYFKGKGWTILDATPANLRGGLNQANLSLITILKDFIEYVWFSKIVNFTPNDQRMFLSSLLEAIKDSAPRFSTQQIRITIIIIVGIVAIILLLIKLRNFKFRLKTREKQIRENIKYAENFYGKMLKKLAKKKFIRPLSMTPLEFVKYLEDKSCQELNAVKILTAYFCQVKYGEIPLTKEQKIEINKSLEDIIQKQHSSPR